MTTKKDYSEKLKDPRWQKKRLEIMQRDNFTCRLCGDTKTTLHVHHFSYEKGKQPWEYEDQMLITICENCHNLIHCSRNIVSEDGGFIPPHSFLMAHPSCIKHIESIGNHKGIWTIVFMPYVSLYKKINTIALLKEYIYPLDFSIYDEYGDVCLYDITPIAKTGRRHFNE